GSPAAGDLRCDLVAADRVLAAVVPGGHVEAGGDSQTWSALRLSRCARTSPGGLPFVPGAGKGGGEAGRRRLGGGGGRGGGAGWTAALASCRAAAACRVHTWADGSMACTSSRWRHKWARHCCTPARSSS